MYWHIEFQQSPTRCLRVCRKDGHLVRCWHNEHALQILAHQELKRFFSVWRLCGIHRYRLNKEEVKLVLLIAAQCAMQRSMAGCQQEIDWNSTANNDSQFILSS